MEFDSESFVFIIKEEPGVFLERVCSDFEILLVRSGGRKVSGVCAGRVHSCQRTP